MAGFTLEKGKRIYHSGQPMTAIHLITKGRVAVEFPGGIYHLEKGDVIGICELCSEIHYLSYTVVEETTILSYPVTNMEALEAFLIKHTDVTRLFLLSLFRQITLLLEESTKSELLCSSLHQNMMSDYSRYCTLSSRYGVSAQTPDGFEEITSYINDETPDFWLNSYYVGLHSLYAGSGDTPNALLRESGISIGMLRKGSLDFRKTFTVLEDRFHYQTRIAACYFNPSGNDLFERLTALYFQIGNNNEDGNQLLQDIERMIQTFGSIASSSKDQTAVRVRSFREKVDLLSVKETSSPEQKDGLSASILQELSGSLDTILQFADMETAFSDSFRKNIMAFRALKDRSDMSDSVIRLRKKLTEQFYELYSTVFMNSITSSHLGLPIKMFLYFGYVDEVLAGTDNCLTLYQLACGMDESSSSFGVYTFYQWLLAIYNGTKMPSRNEFDEDYTDYINKKKHSNTLSAKELALLEDDPIEKVNYELKNLFPQVNKITSGRITTFCPVFCADNVIKDLNGSLITVSMVRKALSLIKSIDYSAFYRETLDQSNPESMGRLTVHKECLPDIILMPNIGIRGVMWQEIEGRKRTTPSRMLLSVFHMEDFTTTMIRLTGEFRWELCKRVQGSRWNDVTEHSLTSEYFDYVQFFRKNHELSADAKEKLKSSLQRAKNSFKEMFVRDYMTWVLFEGNGSPRLNKIARRILLTYCPFPAKLSATLEQNPLFGELIERRKIRVGQQLHQLDNLKQKIRNNGEAIPESLEAEYAFIQGQI